MRSDNHLLQAANKNLYLLEFPRWVRPAAAFWHLIHHEVLLP